MCMNARWVFFHLGMGRGLSMGLYLNVLLGQMRNPDLLLGSMCMYVWRRACARSHFPRVGNQSLASLFTSFS